MVLSIYTGVWNNASSRIQFSIEPSHYQSVWFVLLSICMVVLAILQARAFRVRQVNRRLRIRLEACQAERERIARDLHDTLLQSFPGILMKLQVDINGLPIPEDAVERQRLNQTLDQARGIVVESRDQVSRLRSEDCGNLSEILSIFAKEHTSPSGMTLNVSVDGHERKLNKDVFEEIAFITKEAMRNAYAHSGGKLLTVRLNYRHDALFLDVRDDGTGIPLAILDVGQRPGHWGLMGMRERAKQMSANLSIESPSGKGTRVTLCIPARIAYVTFAKTGRFDWSKRQVLWHF